MRSVAESPAQMESSGLTISVVAVVALSLVVGFPVRSILYINDVYSGFAA